jgi:hypothetical protein
MALTPNTPSHPSHVVDLLTRPADAADFWIVGAAKMGKTTFLRALQEHLENRLQRAKEARPLVLHAHVSCADHYELEELYATLLQRLLESTRYVLAPDATVPALRLLGRKRERIDAATMPAYLYGDIAAVLSMIPDQEGCLAILIDDADCDKHTWIAQLFANLSGLPSHLKRSNLPRWRSSVVIAARRRVGRSSYAERLLGRFSPVQLQPLTEAEVEQLGWLRQLNWTGQQLARIVEATGLHPWVVRQLVDQLQPADWQGEWRGRIETIANAPECGVIVEEGFAELSPSERALVHLLCVERGGAVADTLADRLKLEPAAVKPQLENCEKLGLVYRRGGAYAVSDVIRTRMLRHTGAIAITGVLDDTRAKLATLQARPFGGAAPCVTNFSRTGILVDALQTGYYTIEGDWKEQLRPLRTMLGTLNRETIEQLPAIVPKFIPHAEKLASAFKDYVDSEWRKGDPTFVMRPVDKDAAAWLDVPFELLSTGSSPLGLAGPLYYQSASDGSTPPYHLSRNCLGDGVAGGRALIILAARGGTMDGYTFPELREGQGECEAVRAAMRRGLSIDDVTVLSDIDAPGLSAQPLTPESLDDALTEPGLLMVHYSGHLHVPEAGESGALLGAKDGGLQLYPFTRLKDRLRNHAPRFVYLNGCRGAQPHGARYLAAAHLCLEAGARVVIAMRWAVDDAVAARFSRLFYARLQPSIRPETALWRARQELGESAGSAAWAAPVMFAR